MANKAYELSDEEKQEFITTLKAQENKTEAMKKFIEAYEKQPNAKIRQTWIGNNNDDE